MTHELAQLPHEARLRYDPVPTFPTRSDFEQAAKNVAADASPAAVWHREAVRWRLANEGKPLDLVAIADATLRAIQASA